MLRSYVKNAAAYAVSWARLDALAHVWLHRQIPFVVAYHRVVERLNACGPLALPAMEIRAAMLERHLDWLGRHFRIVSLDDLGARLDEPAGSKPLAVVTFDDGYSDIFHYAFPLLKRKGIPAGVFVVTDLVGTAELPLHERFHAVLAEAWPRWTSPICLSWSSRPGTAAPILRLPQYPRQRRVYKTGHRPVPRCHARRSYPGDERHGVSGPAHRAREAAPSPHYSSGC